MPRQMLFREQNSLLKPRDLNQKQLPSPCCCYFGPRSRGQGLSPLLALLLCPSRAGGSGGPHGSCPASGLARGPGAAGEISARCCAGDVSIVLSTERSSRDIFALKLSSLRWLQRKIPTSPSNKEQLWPLQSGKFFPTETQSEN